MLQYYIRSCEAARRRLAAIRSDSAGVVSLEYVIVAAAIVGVVTVAFGANGPLATAVSGALGTIGQAITAAAT